MYLTAEGCNNISYRSMVCAVHLQHGFSACTSSQSPHMQPNVLARADHWGPILEWAVRELASCGMMQEGLLLRRGMQGLNSATVHTAARQGGRPGTKDLHAGGGRGHPHLQLPLQPPRAPQSRVQGLRPVGGCDHYHLRRMGAPCPLFLGPCRQQRSNQRQQGPGSASCRLLLPWGRTDLIRGTRV